MPENNYQPGDQITRAQAWNDLKYDIRQLASRRAHHAALGIVVDLVRIAGISDRDTSQKVAKIGVGVAAVGLAAWVLF